jgi:N-acetylglutamate synthase-like GNAT family acetyltransferase
MFTILSAKESDLQDAKAWFESNELPVHDLEQILPFSMLLRVNDVLMGHITYSFLSDDACMVTSIFVSPSIRNQNFGDTLIRSLMNLLSRRGIDVIKIKSSCTVVDFFQHFGFQQDEDVTLCVLPSIDAFFKIPCKGNKA